MKALYIEGSVKESVRLITQLLAQQQQLQQRLAKPMAKRGEHGRFVAANGNGGAEYARRGNGQLIDEAEDDEPTRGGSRLERMRYKGHFVRPAE